MQIIANEAEDVKLVLLELSLKHVIAVKHLYLSRVRLCKLMPFILILGSHMWMKLGGLTISLVVSNYFSNEDNRCYQHQRFSLSVSAQNI